MNLSRKSGFYRLAQITIHIICAAILAGCYSIGKTAVPATSTFGVQISTAPYLTETATPACMVVPGVEIKVVPISANRVSVKVLGLIPNEPLRIIFHSEFQGQERRIECCIDETANENGTYEFSMGLRSQDRDVEFKDWQVQVIHSRGVACTNFSLS